MNYHIFTTGCQQNYYEANKVAHLFEKMGCLNSEEKTANIIVIMACSVRQKPIDRIFGKLQVYKKLPQKRLGSGMITIAFHCFKNSGKVLIYNQKN